MAQSRFFDGLGNAYRSNNVNIVLANRNQTHNQTGSAQCPIDLDGHNTFTSMLLNDSPVREPQFGNRDADAPSLWDMPSLNGNEPYNQDTWLSLSLPGTDVSVSYNPTTAVAPNVVEPEGMATVTSNVEVTSTVARNQIPVEPNRYNINPNSINLHVHSNQGMPNITLTSYFSPLVLNLPRPQSVTIEFGGRMVQAVPVELNPVVSNPLRPIVRPDPELWGTPIVHNIEHSVQFVRRLIEKGINHALQPGRDEPYIQSGEFLQLVRHDNVVDLWERDDLITQICRSYSEGPTHTRANRMRAQDPEEISSDDEQYNDMYSSSDNDDEDYMIADPEDGYQIVFAGDVDDVVGEDFDAMSYEDMLRMQDEVGNVDVGIPSELIDVALRKEPGVIDDTGDKKGKVMPTPTSSSSSSIPSSDFCSICLDGYKATDSKGILYCEHVFHYPCITTWLKGKNSCPLCRKIALELRN